MVIIFRILIEQSCQVKILVIIKIMFSTILHLVRRLVKLITTLVEFLLRLSVVSEQMVDSLQTAPEDVRQPQLAGAEQGVACRIAEVQEEDNMSYGDLNLLMLKDTEVVENVLPWLTRVIDTQVVLLEKYASHLLDKVHGVLVRQLEMGEAVSKRVAMKVPANLHKVWGLGRFLGRRACGCSAAWCPGGCP